MFKAENFKERSHPDDGNDSDRKNLLLPLSNGPLFDSEPVKIIAGATQRTFYVHEAQLCTSSGFFIKIFNSDWKESETRTVVLPQAGPESFGVYTKWLYSGQFYITEPADTMLEQIDSYKDREYFKIFQCYKLGDFLQDNDFKDALIDALINKMAVKGKLLTFANGVYNHSAALSPHRQLVLDCTLKLWTKNDFERIAETDPPYEFLIDLAKAMPLRSCSHLHKNTTKAFFKNLDMCKYHEHTRHGKPCYKTRQNTLF